MHKENLALPFCENQDLWQKLAGENRPIVFYGMGNGAEKLAAILAKKNISWQAVFASDNFVRGHFFLGHPVLTLAQVAEKYGDFVVLLAFGTDLPPVMYRIEEIGKKYQLYAPDIPLFGKTLFDQSFAKIHYDQMVAAKSLLADEQSRLVFDALIRFKLSGSIELLKRCATPKEEVFTNLIPLSNQEDFVDLGAYTGDTIGEFLHHTGGAFSSIVAVEPQGKNAEKLLAYLVELGLESKTKVIHKAIWSRAGLGDFSAASGRGASLQMGQGEAIFTTTIDDILSKRRCSFLKMDVEGAEREALLGGVKSIRRQKPKLAIAAYHRPEDFFTLPLMLHKINPNYQIFLRKHPYFPAWETNLYAK